MHYPMKSLDASN